MRRSSRAPTPRDAGEGVGELRPMLIAWLAKLVELVNQ
jgi:hypothetical protein